MSFLNSLSVNLSEFHIKKIQDIDNFDYSNVLKKVNHDLGGVSEEYLASGLKNLKRYYVVALLDPINQHAVSSMVDPFWHSHVLHTKEYIDFTTIVFNQYIHHEPLHHDNIEEVKRIKELYKYTLNIYSKIFKDINEEWWPKVSNTSDLGPVICYHQAHQRNGIGQTLFKCAQNELFKQRLTPFLVWSIKENSAACRFYEKLGGELVANNGIIHFAGEAHVGLGYLFK